MNAAFQMPKFDPYSSTYNPRWAKCPNFLWIGPNALMPTNQGGGSQENSSSSAYHKPRFQEVYNARRGPPPQLHMAQLYPSSDYIISWIK